MKVKDMMYVSMFTAVVAALGLIPAIQLPFYSVPITAQTLGVMLAGSILGAKRGGLSLLIFVLLVAVGAQILPGPRGGLSVLLGPTGGFILSWPIAAFIIGILVEKSWTHLNFSKVLIYNVIGGILVIYAIGIPYSAFIIEIPVSTAAMGAIAFIPGDIVKVLLASFIALRIRKSKPLIEIKHQHDSA